MIDVLSPHMSDIVLAGGIVLLACAALHDVAARTVPNTVSVLVFAVGAVFRAMDGHLPTGLAASAAVFAAAAVCWRRGWMGGGDVKLMAACAILVPPQAVADMVLDVALAGGVLALTYLLLRVVVPRPTPSGQRPRSMLARVLRAERWRIHRNCPLPYASAIAAGALVCLLKA